MPEPVALSARSPKYPALYDDESGVRFIQGRAEVTPEQAHTLANRRFVDGILIGEFDEEGRPVNELPAKKWAAAQRAEPVNPADRIDLRDIEPGADPQNQAPSDDATGEGRRRRTRKE